MHVTIPHNLTREEVRRRLGSRTHKLADHIPGGVAEMDTAWPGEDHMTIALTAMGQRVTASVQIEDRQVVVDATLPGMLSFMEPMVGGAVETQGRRLLAP